MIAGVVGTCDMALSHILNDFMTPDRRGQQHLSPPLFVFLLSVWQVDISERLDYI
jgi:hypothetical protein